MLGLGQAKLKTVHKDSHQSDSIRLQFLALFIIPREASLVFLTVTLGLMKEKLIAKMEVNRIATFTILVSMLISFLPIPM